MIDTEAKPARYIKLLALVVVLGLISALVTFAFMALVHQGTHLVWEQAAMAIGVDLRLFTLLVCTIGGLLVGVLVKLFGDHSGIFAEVMLEFGKTGRFDYRNAPGIVITAFVSLIAGASLGPEAPLGLLGGAVGLLFMLTLKRLQRLFQAMKGRVVLRGLVGGLGMGIIGALLPLTLFSGEEGTSDLITNASEIGVVMLVVLGLAKLFATTLVLATGWKGGYIFPIMFASVALGLAVSLVFPGIPVAVAVAATMAGALVAALRAPLFAALFTTVLVQKETGAVIAVAVVASALLTALLALYAARRAVEQPQPS